MAPRRKKAGTNSDKSGKPKKDRVKKSGAAAAKKPHPSKGKKFPGKRKAHFAKATAARKALVDLALACRGRPLPLSSKLRHLNRPTISGGRAVPKSKPA